MWSLSGLTLRMSRAPSQLQRRVGSIRLLARFSATRTRSRPMLSLFTIRDDRPQPCVNFGGRIEYGRNVRFENDSNDGLSHAGREPIRFRARIVELILVAQSIRIRSWIFWGCFVHSPCARVVWPAWR